MDSTRIAPMGINAGSWPSISYEACHAKTYARGDGLSRYTLMPGMLAVTLVPVHPLIQSRVGDARLAIRENEDLFLPRGPQGLWDGLAARQRRGSAR